MIVIYCDELDFITTSWIIDDADERDWTVGNDRIIFTSARFENVHCQTLMQMVEVFHFFLTTTFI